MPGWYFAHVHDDVTLHILRMLEGTSSLEAAPLELMRYNCSFFFSKIDEGEKEICRIIVYI